MVHSNPTKGVSRKDLSAVPEQAGVKDARGVEFLAQCYEKSWIIALGPVMPRMVG